MEQGQVFDSSVHLDLALKSAGMGIFSYDVCTKRAFFDEQATSLLGIDPEIYGYAEDDFLEIAHPDDREEVKTLLFLSVKKMKDFEAEYRVIWKDGSLHYLVSRARIVRNENNSPVRLSGLIWDITEQKFFEANLHENLRKMNSFINNLNGVVFRFRFDDSFTMEFISHGVRAITGYPSWDFQMNKYRSYHSLIVDADREKVIREIREAVSKDCQYNIEYRITSSNGEQRWLSERGQGISGMDRIAVEGIITDISEKKTIESRLNRSLKQLKQLNKYLQTVRENERIAISRELHDDLGQALTIVKIDLRTLQSDFSDYRNAPEKIEKIISRVGDTIKSVQNITAQLRPQIIDDLGLEAAIEWYARDFSARTGIKFKLIITPVSDLSSGKSVAIFRIFQESLTNITRHSKASKAEISLSTVEGSIILKVKDDGIGISEEDFRSKKSFGLISMRERAMSFGGELKISIPENGGTLVTLVLPVSDQEEHEDFDL